MNKVRQTFSFCIYLVYSFDISFIFLILFFLPTIPKKTDNPQLSIKNVHVFISTSYLQITGIVHKEKTLYCSTAYIYIHLKFD